MALPYALRVLLPSASGGEFVSAPFERIKASLTAIRTAREAKEKREAEAKRQAEAARLQREAVAERARVEAGD